MHKRIVTLIFSFLILCTITAQEIDENYIKANYNKIEVNIPMRDGIKLFTAIYTPKDISRSYPILLNRTPYTVAPYGEDSYKSSLGNFKEMAKEGYIFVYQDVRGKWMSEGVFENVRPTKSPTDKKGIDESTDTYDTIDWLVKNVKNNNNKVGMYGISYPGFYASAALVGSHPALKAVSPQAPVTDWFVGDDFRHGGALLLFDAFRFMYTFDAARSHPVDNTKGPKGFSLEGKDYYKFFLNNKNLGDIKKNYLGHTVKFWNDLQKHQTLDTFWYNRNITHHLDQVKPAVMIVGGTFDAEDVYGTFETYRQIEKQNKNNNNILVVGPWYHGGWVRSDGSSFGDIRFGEKTSLYYQEKFELPFFDFYLKGKGSFNPAEANVYVTGANKWYSFDQWPPKESTTKKYYFNTNNRLTTTAPLAKEAFVDYESDPNNPVPFQEGIITERTREYMIADQRFVANRPDVLVFETEPLEEDLILTGPITANLHISMSGSDADFVVKVIDVYPDSSTAVSAVNDKVVMPGYQMLVRGEVLRGRFRNSFSKPEPFTPNAITPVSVVLPDVAHTFKKGHRLMVQVQHSWFPLVEQNPNQFIDVFQAKSTDFIKNKHRLYFDKEHPSDIVIQVL